MSVRSTVAPALATAATLFVPATAGAHGGIILASTTAGPYRVQVAGAPLTEPGRPPAIDVTVYVANATSGSPVSGASVRTTVTADERTVTPDVREIAGGYEAIVPVRDAYTVGQQTIDVRVAGPLGTGRVTVRPNDDQATAPTALIVASAAVLGILVAVAIRVRRRRGDTEADVWPDATS